MNVDDTSILLATQGDTHNANLFAYCCNNPVNQVDYTGMLFEKITESFSESFVSLVEIITNDHYLGRGEDNNFFEWKRMTVGSRLTNLYDLKINFVNEDNPDIYNTVKKCFLISPDLTCVFIAFFAQIFFCQSVGRQFLFSPDCIEKEIKYHIGSYIAHFKRENSNPVDISEADVYQDKILNKVFDYNSGIRDCYRWTDADPYLITYTKYGVTYRTRTTKSYIDTNTIEWESWLRYYGK